MLKRALSWAIVLLIALMPLPARAADGHEYAVDGILSYAIGDLSLQEWLDGPVTEAAGSAMDGYILILNRTGRDADFSAYVQQALKKLQPGEIANPVSRQRCALALISCGALESVPAALADETIGKLGVMSYIYGLHLINNGAPSSLWTAESLVDKLLELQMQDGGWAVMGQYGDTDVTAMCLQALACRRGNNARVEEAIARGVALLAQKQLENGGFASTGRENAESAAQVIVALSSLGIDPDGDARFVKGGTSAVDALMAYRMPDGGFAHLPGDAASNDTASLQAMQALTALSMPGARYFDLSSIVERDYTPKNAHGWKFWALIGVGALALVGAGFALTRRRGRIKQLVFVLLASGIAAALVCFINVESASNYYSADLPTGDEIAGQVYLSIRCDTVAGRADDGSTPEDGIILERTALPFRAEDTVFDVLTSAGRLYEIQMEHEGGTAGMAYVSGINYLYEYVYGELSGWLYAVNGETPSIGCGSYAVRDGDEIIWQYTTNLGEDLK